MEGLSVEEFIKEIMQRMFQVLFIKKIPISLFINIIYNHKGLGNTKDLQLLLEMSMNQCK